MKLWDPSLPMEQGCLSSKNIMHDIHEVIHSAYPKFYAARGIALHTMLKGGRCDASTVTPKKKRGGVRVKCENYELITDMWIHDSISHITNEKIQASIDRASL